VFDDAICTIIDMPTGTKKTADSQNTRDQEKSIRQTPKEAEDTTIQRQCPDEGAHSCGAHQDSECACPAVQDLIGKNRHQHGIRHSNQAYQAE
jgi:hypothetical protein